MIQDKHFLEITSICHAKIWIRPSSIVMDLFQESYAEENVYYPPQHLCIYGDENIKRLHDACQQALNLFDSRLK